MKTVTVYSAVMVDESAPLSLHEMACLCEQQIDWVVTLVREGLVFVERDVVIAETSPEQWVFASAAAARARQIARVQRDFDINLDAAALMVDLMQEVRQLRAQLQGLNA
ncbi:chaperone modulator CbpM [Zwartia sp.]|uniref:chaperone modulator CbpM n=1 Tax=Zwartia sp. TaxID=2978004 RepID=UPI002728EF95|nr:chaperone modulator CbpM [Zwartia sp.]MDO9024845.1 chaperone modulator CbpM [Zwartia sp.]